MTQSVPTTQTEIMQAFERLVQARADRATPVATKEEEAQRAKNQDLLTQVAAYTVDHIVNGTAALQLEFGQVVTDLSARLTQEADKLGELAKAIAVETAHLEQLQQVRLVADALYILRQEHAAKLQQVTDAIATKTATLEKEMTQTRKHWQREQALFESQQQAAVDLRAQQRQQEQADYDYEVARAGKIALDELAEQQRQQERELAELATTKAAAWRDREAVLTANAATFAEQQTQIATFEERLKAAFNTTKGEAIQECDREAKVKSDLLEKEWAAEQQGLTFKLTSLEGAIARQETQITDLLAQLQTVTQQAQSLAVQAFNRPA